MNNLKTVMKHKADDILQGCLQYIKCIFIKYMEKDIHVCPDI